MLGHDLLDLEVRRVHQGVMLLGLLLLHLLLVCLLGGEEGRWERLVGALEPVLVPQG